SLWREAAQGFLRERLGFTGAAFSDDLEMGALASFGSLPERCVAAARAGCDLLFVCSRIQEYGDCVEAVERGVPVERQFEAQERLSRYANRLVTLRERSAKSQESLENLKSRISRLRDWGSGDASTRVG